MVETKTLADLSVASIWKQPVFKVRDRDRAGTVSTSETETLIHEYSRLRPRPGKCIFSRPRPRPRPGKWSRPRVSLISVANEISNFRK